jgi:hypothetical protein
MESPFQMECTLIESIALKRDIGGNGNIMLLEVVKIHADEHAFSDGKLDPQKLDLVARMGYDYYCRAHGNAIFEVFKPKWNGIGFDALPRFIKESDVLTGAQLAKLAGIKEIPQKEPAEFMLAIQECGKIPEISQSVKEGMIQKDLENVISVLLNMDKIDLAWRLLAESITE